MADAARRSDLGVRTLSAAVMLAVASAALFFGGTVLRLFIALVGALVLLEWRGLVLRFPGGAATRGLWLVCGAVYAVLGCGSALLLYFAGCLIPLLGAVIGTDIGAYFAGRLIGGPRIAPAISPSKTWAGLVGGMIGAGLLLNAVVSLGGFQAPGADPDFLADTVSMRFFGGPVAVHPLVIFMAAGAGIAVVAQAGDFFESWMKRRAGVKDSGKIIPGHGGVFDRVDGLLPACIATTAILWLTGLLT